MYKDLIESLNNKKTDSQKNKKIEVLGKWWSNTLGDRYENYK